MTCPLGGCGASYNTLCTGAVSLTVTEGQHRLLELAAWARRGSDTAGAQHKIPGHRSRAYLLMGCRGKWH